MVRSGLKCGANEAFSNYRFFFEWQRSAVKSWPGERPLRLSAGFGAPPLRRREDKEGRADPLRSDGPAKKGPGSGAREPGPRWGHQSFCGPWPGPPPWAGRRRGVWLTGPGFRRAPLVNPVRLLQISANRSPWYFCFAPKTVPAFSSGLVPDAAPACVGDGAAPQRFPFTAAAKAQTHDK